MNRYSNHLFTVIGASFLLLSMTHAQAQLRRPGIITIKHEDRNETSLVPEKGAVYVEGLVSQPITVSVPKKTPAYYKLTGNRWLGDIFGNQKATLVAISDRAYKIRARAQQGQVAGWVRKDAVSGVPDGFEEKLTKFHERHQIVKQLIDKKQVALGMTTEEVIASIGPPDSKTSHLDEKGRKDTFQFISYARTPQTVVGYDRFGVPFQQTHYVEVESGRVTIEFTNNLVSSISESEGLNFNKGVPIVQVPPFLPFF